MNFDIKKYKNAKFNENPAINKKIIALLTWFEYIVYKNNHGIKKQIQILSRWIKKLNEYEEYEISDFFLNKKFELISSIEKKEKEGVFKRITNYFNKIFIKK